MNKGFIVRIPHLSKISAILLVYASILVSLPSVYAVERLCFVGLSAAPEYKLRGDDADTGAIVGVDWGVFVSESIAARFAFDSGVLGRKNSQLSTGLQLFFSNTSNWQPYVSTDFLFQYAPRKEIGWKFRLGVEWDWVRFTGLNNMRMYMEVGAEQLFFDNKPQSIYLEAPRFGLLWHF